MKKVLHYIFFVLLSLVIVAGVYLGYYYLFDIASIKGEQEIHRLASPDEKYEMIAYLNSGNATTNYSVLVVLRNLQSGKDTNIYWNSPCDIADMQWIDNNVARINDITLQIPKQKYDFRRN